MQTRSWGWWLTCRSRNRLPAGVRRCIPLLLPSSPASRFLLTSLQRCFSPCSRHNLPLLHIVQTVPPPSQCPVCLFLSVQSASAQARQLLLISAPGISLIALLVVAPSSRARERMTESSREDDRKSIERGCPQERTIQKRGLVGRRHRTGRRHTQTCTHAYTHARIHKCKHAH